MATVQITVPDELVPRLTAAVRACYPQYEALGIAAAFKAATAQHWRNILIGYERGLADRDAQAVVDAAVDASTGDSGGIK